MRRWSIGALAALTVLLAGCFRYDATITVTEDGSGTVATTIAVKDDLLPALIESNSGNPFDRYTTATNLPPEVKAVPYKQTGFTGMVVTIAFPGGDDIAPQVQEAMGTDEAGMPPEDSRPIPTLADEFTLRREGTGWHFKAHLIDASTLTGEDFTSAEAKEVLKDTTVRLRLKLPGQIVKSNADERRDGALIWNIDLTAKGERTLEAISMQPGIPQLPSVGLVWLFSLLGAAVLMVAGVTFQVWRMRD